MSNPRIADMEDRRTVITDAAPNFFIVGAPKCGTTALYSYLRQHPDVFMPASKEPKHFATDLDSGSARDGEVFVRDRTQYLELFAEGRGARRIGEATALYLYSREAAGNIHAFNPEARIIVMLRHPVDVMHAFHGERLYNGNEDIPDFAEALAAEEDRRSGHRLPDGAISRALQYRELVRFSEQLRRYFDTFGRSRVHVILFDDFKSDTEGCYRELLRFLELREDFVPELDVVNARKRIRSERLANLVRRPPPYLRSAVRALVPAGVRAAGFNLYKAINIEIGNRAGLAPAVHARLTAELRTEILELSRLIDRDLSHWIEE
jgi:hypothetical protein